MIDPKEIFALAAKRAVAVFARGSATHPIGSPSHWRKLSSRDHLLRAARHIEKVLLRIPSEEDDLAHAFVRYFSRCSGSKKKMADSEFELSAIVSANIDQYKDAMSELVAATNEASQALRTQLTGGAQSASEALEGIGEKSKKAAEETESSFDSIRETATHLLETFAVFEGIDILKEQVKQSLEFGESMQKLSVETGASTNFLQQLKFAADATGTSFESVNEAVRRLTEVYATLSAGKGSPQLLGALSSAHINVSQLANIQTGFEAISHAVQEFGVQSSIARSLVVQLLGRQGLDFRPLLANFDKLKQEAADLHIVLPPEMLESLDRGSEALHVLGAVIRSDGEQLLSGLAPAIAQTATNLSQMFAEASKSGELDQWAKTIQEDMKSLPAVVGDAATAFKLFAEAIEGDLTILKGMATAVEALDKLMGGGAAFEQGLTGGGNGLLKNWNPSAAALSRPMSAHGAGGQIQGSMLSYLQGPQTPPPAAPPPPPPPPPPNSGGLPSTQSAAAAKKALEEALQSYQQQLSAYTEEQATEVALANNTAQAKVQAATNVFEKAKSLIGQTGAVTAAGYQKEVDAAKRAGIEELNARREMLNQTKALAAEQITGGATEQIGGLGVQKAQLQELLAAHQITNQQELAGEQSLVTQELAIEMSKFQTLSNLYSDDAQKVQQYAQQEVEVQQKAQEQILELQKQALAQQEQATQQAGTKMAADMNSGLTLMEKYFETSGKNQQKVMQEAFQSILKDFQDMITQMITKWLESTAIFQSFAGGEGGGKGGGGGIIGGIGAVAGSLFGGGAGAIGGNPGLAGLGPSAFAPGQGLTANMFQQPLSQAFQGITGTIGTTFSTAFQSTSSAVSSVFSQGFQGASSALSSIFGSIFGGASGGSGGGGISSIMSMLGPLMGLLAFEGGGIVPSAAGGMVVPGTGGGSMAILHPREMVLPAKYSEGVQRMIDRGNGDGSQGGQGLHVENHFHGDMSSLDNDGMGEILDKHGSRIAETVADHIGRLGMRERYR